MNEIIIMIHSIIDFFVVKSASKSVNRSNCNKKRERTLAKDTVPSRRKIISFILLVKKVVMKNTRFALVLLAVCTASSGGVEAFATLTTTIQRRVALSMSATDDSEASDIRKEPSMDRRSALLATVATTVVAVAPSPALALKAKNEGLCGTGFFEHIYEYKCTAIGDIEDEGYSKSMSNAESGMADSLMGKLGVDSGDAFGDFDGSNNSKSKSSSDKEASKKSNSSGGK